VIFLKNISILGATGSIGTQTLDVIRKERFRLIAVTANKSYLKIIDIINEFKPKLVGMMDETAYEKVKNYCFKNGLDIEVLCGIESLNKAATMDETDIVVTSVVGMIGLLPTINAIRAQKDIALANKETLVVGGEIVMKEAKKAGVKILPVDSEHGAIFQCLQGNKDSQISKLLVTASGGPFRGKHKSELTNIKPENALKHPKWNMGKKISIDSATLMNKGLEVIEAHWLFNVPFENIKVVVHPQSIVHSMVEYSDGSVISQMATTDMRLPIQYALNFPNRGERIVETLDFFSVGSLTFEKPDVETFGCLELAYKAGKMGGNMPTVLNAANEVAVELFLENKITFLQIEDIIKEATENFQYIKDIDLEIILDTDNKVREYVKNKYDL
jgi:1-deoxy-D-xylulose-5-phosphate reductoisomerase